MNGSGVARHHTGVRTWRARVTGTTVLVAIACTVLWASDSAAQAAAPGRTAFPARMLQADPSPAPAKRPVVRSAATRRSIQAALAARFPQIHPGAYEVGLTAAATSVAGNRSATIGLRVASFRTLGAGLGALEGEMDYSHLSSLDMLDLSLSAAWLARHLGSPVYPFVAVAAGIRQEWLGSFRQARHPVGFDAGVRVLAGPRALFRIEYRFRRVLDDPVADFTEHGIMSGVSLLFGNGS